MNHPDGTQELKTYEAIIRQAIGDNAHIVRAESGLVNAVFLVDRRYVFRFPRDDEVYAQQVFERDICSFLAKHADRLPVNILKPVDIPANHCFVYEYIPGDIMSEQKFMTLDSGQQTAFVQDLLSFINWLGETLQPEIYRQIVKSSAGKPIESWENYIGRTVSPFHDSRYPALIEVCRELTTEMSRYYKDGISAYADRVIHDDLHMGNLLFINGKLSGVIDFGNIMVGDLACELRHFYRLSPEIAQMACNIYEATYGQKVDINTVAWWAKVNDAATLSEKIMTGKIGSPSYVRAFGNLSKWYPNKNWEL